MKPLLRLAPYLKRYKGKIIFGYFFIILHICVSAVIPLVVGRAVDFLQHGTGDYSLVQYALAIVGLTALSGLFLFFTRQSIIVVSREVENDLRLDFFAHLQLMTKKFYNSRTVGDLMAHATNDINNVRNFLGPGIMYSLQTFTRTIVFLYILLSINVEVTLISLAPLPLISILVYFMGKFAYSRSQKVQEKFSDLTSLAQEVFSGIRVVKSFVREEYEMNEFYTQSRDYYKKNLSLAKVQAFTFPMMFLLTWVSIILVIYFGGLKVINGQMTLGNISEFIIYLGQLTWPMIAIGWIVNIIQRAAPSMKRILSITDLKPDIADNNDTDKSITEKDLHGAIEFKDVSFKYPNTETYALKNINLIIPKGTTLGIIGHTGSGKSTFINLLPRIFDVTEGGIYMDGHDIRKIPLKLLRASIGIVPQESFLFSTKIGKNISYSSDSLDVELVENSARSADLYKDVMDFPHKFDTMVGERGITLSGGQKQRTSLARAIYKRPKVLILDDSLSAVDTHTEEQILQELKTIMKGRTNIIISHRISSIQNANNIIVLGHGEIKEEGTHNELLALKGIYYDIYSKQLLEEEIKEL
ncbi:MAG: ABC transporter ATP-binding protein [Ignavibacteriae bacterium]|nr:ABC transporter ATP-binding protein [Ignavibacteriota bacterium]MCB9242604.1 ABC transporter ATP-binding protein [Ignavibacteriales bacterium]